MRCSLTEWCTVKWPEAFGDGPSSVTMPAQRSADTVRALVGAHVFAQALGMGGWGWVLLMATLLARAMSTGSCSTRKSCRAGKVVALCIHNTDVGRALGAKL